MYVCKDSAAHQHTRIGHYLATGDPLQASGGLQFEIGRRYTIVDYRGGDSSIGCRHWHWSGRCTAPRWVGDRLAAPALGLGAGLHALSPPWAMGAAAQAFSTEGPSTPTDC